MNPSEIQQAYAQLWLIFTARCKDASLRAKSTVSAGFKIGRLANQTVEVTGVFHLPEWPYKSSTKKATKVLHILLRGSDVYDCQRNAICRSAVQLKYIQERSVGEPWRSVLEMHYDFDLEQLQAHPLFHAQLGECKFANQDLTDLGLRVAIDRPQDPLYGSLRIPTPHMGLSSVLLGLAADHWSPTVFETFLKEIQGTRLLKWETTCSELKDRLRTLPCFMHSHHWYKPKVAAPSRAQAKR